MQPALPEGLDLVRRPHIAHKHDDAVLSPICLAEVSQGAADCHLPVYGCKRSGQIEAAGYL